MILLLENSKKATENPQKTLKSHKNAYKINILLPYSSTITSWKPKWKKMSKSQSPKKSFPPLILNEKCVEKIKDFTGRHEVIF